MGSKLFKGAAVRVFISLSAVAFIIYSLRDKLGESLHILKTGVNWNWFLVAVLGYFLVQVVMAYRLMKIFKTQGIEIHYGQSLRLCIIGLFFNLFLPSAVGGDIAKAYYAFKHSGDKVRGTTSIIIDRITGFATIIAIALGALFVMGKEITDPRISYIVYAFLLLVLSVFAFFASRRVARNFQWAHSLVPSVKLRNKLSEVYHAIYSCRNHLTTLAYAFLISLTGQSLVILMHYWIALSLGVKIGVTLFFILVPLITIVSMAPSLGGLGVREAGAIYLLSFYMPPEKALALSVLVAFIIYGFSLISGIIYGLIGGVSKKVIEEMEAVT